MRDLVRLGVGIALLVVTLSVAARFLSRGALGAGSLAGGLRVLRAVGGTFFRAAGRVVAVLVFLSGRGRRRVRPLPGATRTPPLRR